MSLDRLRDYLLATRSALPMMRKADAAYSRLLNRYQADSLDSEITVVEIRSDDARWEWIRLKEKEYVIADLSLLDFLVGVVALSDIPHENRVTTESLIFLLLADGFRRSGRAKPYAYCLHRFVESHSLVCNFWEYVKRAYLPDLPLLFMVFHEYTHALFASPSSIPKIWLQIASAASKRLIYESEQLLTDDDALNQLLVNAALQPEAEERCNLRAQIQESCVLLTTDTLLNVELACDLHSAFMVLSTNSSLPPLSEGLSWPEGLTVRQVGDYLMVVAKFLTVLVLIESVRSHAWKLSSGAGEQYHTAEFHRMLHRSNAAVHAFRTLFELMLARHKPSLPEMEQIRYRDRFVADYARWKSDAHHGKILCCFEAITEHMNDDKLRASLFPDDHDVALDLAWMADLNRIRGKASWGGF